MGINVDATISMTFLLGGMLAGAAGLVYALYETTVWYFQGFQAGLIAFTAAVMGGIGNVRGAVLGGLIIGCIQQLSDARIGPQWTAAVVFALPDHDHGPAPARPARRRDEGGGMKRSCAASIVERLPSWWVRVAVGVLIVVRRWCCPCSSADERLPQRDDHRPGLRGHGPRAEHRRRLRRPARPRLRRLLRDRRVLGRLVRVELLLQRPRPRGSSRRWPTSCRASTSTSS